MQFDSRYLAIIAAVVMMLTAVSLTASDLDADPEITRDYGEFYSYTLQFVFDGAEAQTIDWDFGDGTEHSDEWNPRHTYASTGTYFITQTTTNTQGTTVEVYKVQIMGYPVVSFDSNGGAPVDDIQMDSYDAIADRPDDPIKDGYVFDGWFYEPSFENPVDWTAGITKSTTFYAKWSAIDIPVETFTVTFNSNGGSTVPSQTVEMGQTATEPADPVRDGYTFMGWFFNGSAYDFLTPVNSNIALKASWQQNSAPIVNRTVSFNLDGGSGSVPSIAVENGTSVNLPAYNGTKTGYEFAGWSYNSTTYQPGQSFTVSSDVTFKAVWRATAPVVTQITVTFNVDGGSKTVQAQTIQSGSMFTFPAYDGTKENCTFGGWACGLQVYQPGQSVQLTGDVTVKAIWNASEDSGDSSSGSIVDDAKDFAEKNYILIIILIIALIVMALYIRSRRRY